MEDKKINGELNESQPCESEHKHDEHDHHGHDHHHEEHHEHHHDHDHEHHHDHEEHHHHDHDHDDHCDCGHDERHHDHEHHHHDEHEEHHHHHHDHDDHCGCDHDHDHDHDQEHHHHDHGHQYDVPGFRIFETHSHEGATICSFEKDIVCDPDTIVKQMEDDIKTLEKWLDETDAAIGHVKGYVKQSGPVTTFSTVGCGLNIENHEGDTLAIGFASIVFGPTEEELKDKVAEVFSNLGKK